MINLQHADCLDLLRSLPNESVDMVLVDPPYFEIVNNDWDNQWENEDAYLDWCREWTTECHRILKPNRVMCVWGTTKTDTFLRYKTSVLNPTGMTYLNWIIWSYDWGGRTKKTFARKHEDLLVYAKGDEWLFDADAVRIPYKMEKNVREGAVNNPLGKIPTDVWEKNNHTTSKEYCGWHPTQKPIELLRRLIRAYTASGEVVLDCFSGSGSTAIASRMEGRSFVGCEVSEEYHRKSLERINALLTPTEQKESIL
jgi:DNA modification methylase